MLDGEATVKTFRQRDGHTWLLPRNSAFEPILGDEADRPRQGRGGAARRLTRRARGDLVPDGVMPGRGSVGHNECIRLEEAS